MTRETRHGPITSAVRLHLAVRIIARSRVAQRERSTGARDPRRSARRRDSHDRRRLGRWRSRPGRHAAKADAVFGNAPQR